MLSVKTLIPVLISIQVLFGGLVWILFKQDKSAQYWVRGCAMLALGLTLTMLRDPLPFWMGYPLANILALYGWLLFFVSIEILLRGDSQFKIWALLISLLHGAFVALIFYYQLDAYMAMYVGLIWSLVNFYLAFLIYQVSRNNKSRFVLFFAVLYVCSGIVWGSRIVLSHIYGFNLVLDDGLANWLTMLMNTLLVIMRQLNYFAIRFNSLSEERQQIEKLLVEREGLIHGLLKANKTAATGALSASIAHELNQPLGASSLNIQFIKMNLEQNKLDVDGFKEILRSLESDNKRASQVVQSLRHMFLDEVSPVKAIKLKTAISNVLDIIEPELRSKNISLQLNIEEDLEINIKSIEMEQVILNIINNSIRSLRGSATLHPQITIDSYLNNNFVYLRISDNGHGVSEEFKPNLFQLLNTDHQAGMGLGLWLCKHIITRLEGSIWYEDVQGGGARFVIRLPHCSN